MSRRTKDERRRDYLDIGMELVAEGPGAVPPDPGLALAHVRIAEVAERAGVTKGALYHLWDSQEAYWHDLLRYLLDDHRLAGFADVPDVTRQLADELGVRPTAAQWANFVFDHFKDEPTFFARIGVFSYLQDDEFRRGLDEEFRTSLDRFEEITSDYVRANGRRARPGMEIRDFAVAVSALMQGLCLEHRVDPARTPDVVDGGGDDRVGMVGIGGGDDDRVSLFAAGVEGLLDAFTEPVPGGSGRDGTAA